MSLHNAFFVVIDVVTDKGRVDDEFSFLRTNKDERYPLQRVLEVTNSSQEAMLSIVPNKVVAQKSKRLYLLVEHTECISGGLQIFGLFPYKKTYNLVYVKPYYPEELSVIEFFPKGTVLRAPPLDANIAEKKLWHRIPKVYRRPHYELLAPCGSYQWLGVRKLFEVPDAIEMQREIDALRGRLIALEGAEAK